MVLWIRSFGVKWENEKFFGFGSKIFGGWQKKSQWEVGAWRNGWGWGLHQHTCPAEVRHTSAALGEVGRGMLEVLRAKDLGNNELLFK